MIRFPRIGSHTPRIGPHPTACKPRLAPNFGRRLSDAIRDKQAERGIAVCGSGIGISIAVNREPACRCALVNEPLSAKLSRQHNDANVIALGGRLTGLDLAKACVDAFLTTDFEGGRHQRRVDQLTALGIPGAPTPLEESTHGDRA